MILTSLYDLVVVFELLVLCQQTVKKIIVYLHQIDPVMIILHVGCRILLWSVSFLEV